MHDRIMSFAPDTAPHYSRVEDAQGLAVASIAAALGIHLLRSAGLVTGGTAGFALIIAYMTGWSFGLVFFVINIPFYALAWRARGPVFFVKSLAAVTLVSLMAEALKPLFQIAHIHPAAAAVLFGYPRVSACSGCSVIPAVSAASRLSPSSCRIATGSGRA